MEPVLEEEKGGVRSMRNGTPPNMSAKKNKKAPVSAKKKVKGQARVRRRTVNPKKVRRGDKQRGGGAAEEDSSDGEQFGAKSGQIQHKSHKGSGESSEEEEVGMAKNEGEDEEWSRLQESVQKHSKKKYDRTKTESHPVHAPHFPEVRSGGYGRITELYRCCAGEAGGVVALCSR